MNNTTLAMVAVLAAVTMLSVGLAVPTQQAIASDGGRDGNGGGGDGVNTVIVQENECSRGDFDDSCQNTATVTNDIDNSERGPGDALD